MKFLTENVILNTGFFAGQASMKHGIRALFAVTVRLVLLGTFLTSCNSAVLPGGGGIGGTGIISGRVDGFGSIIIEDQRFDTDNATFEINGKVADITDIHIGMKVTAQVDFETMQASTVYYQPIVVGPIEKFDPDTGKLKILRQELHVNQNTLLDGVTLDSLTPGLVVEVSGVRNSNNVIVVNYIAVSSDDTARYLVGRIEDKEEKSQRALVSGTILGYQRVLEDLGLSNLEYSDRFLSPNALIRADLPHDYHLSSTCEGQIEEEFLGLSAVPTDAWLESEDCSLVTNVASVMDISLTPDKQVELYGIVTALLSTNSFLINGIEVTITEATTINSVRGNSGTDKAVLLNDFVVVKGRAITEHRMHAKHIRITDDR